MAKKEAYNYKEAFEHPIMIFQLTDKFVLPFGVRLSRIIAFAVILLIMLLFRDFFFAIGSIVPGFSLVIFVGLPFLVSGWLLKINVDGKKLHYFLYDFSIYFFTQKI
ncbi:TPA: TcpE family conjugal transfer membrane protein, partial [Listeria monocytogenes]